MTKSEYYAELDSRMRAAGFAPERNRCGVYKRSSSWAVQVAAHGDKWDRGLDEKKHVARVTVSAGYVVSRPRPKTFGPASYDAVVAHALACDASLAAFERRTAQQQEAEERGPADVGALLSDRGRALVAAGTLRVDGWRRSGNSFAARVTVRRPLTVAQVVRLADALAVILAPEVQP